MRYDRLGRIGSEYDNVSPSRRAMLASFDNYRRQVDTRGTADSIDLYQQQAIEVLTSARLANALDLSKEDGRVRRRSALHRSHRCIGRTAG